MDTDKRNDTYHFKSASLNVRGLNDRKKRRSVFRWIKKNKFDLCLMQETHSTMDVQNRWRNEWGGEIIWSHGASNSRGVAILMKPGLDITILDTYKDAMGRLLIISAKIQDSEFTIIN